MTLLDISKVYALTSIANHMDVPLPKRVQAAWETVGLVWDADDQPELLQHALAAMITMGLFALHSLPGVTDSVAIVNAHLARIDATGLLSRIR